MQPPQRLRHDFNVDIPTLVHGLVQKPAEICCRRAASNLVEHDGRALPGDTVLPVVVGGVHGGATEHAGDGAGSVGAVIGDATPGGGRADVTGVVVSQEGLEFI